jgi:hypothetical protein
MGTPSGIASSARFIAPIDIYIKTARDVPPVHRAGIFRRRRGCDEPSPPFAAVVLDADDIRR